LDKTGYRPASVHVAEGHQKTAGAEAQQQDAETRHQERVSSTEDEDTGRQTDTHTHRQTDSETKTPGGREIGPSRLW